MRRGGLAGGVTLVLIGLAFLASNLGLLPLSPWDLVASYWPLLLILAGLAVLFGATFRWLIVVLLVAVIGVAVLGVFLGWSGPQERTTTSIIPDPAVSGVTRLQAGIVLNAGMVRTGQPVPGLYRLDLTHPLGTPPVRTVAVHGDLASLEVESRGWLLSGGRYPKELVVGFSPEAELDLDLRLTAGEVDLDLSQYRLGRLSVSNVAGKVTVRLGAVQEAVPVELRVTLGDLVVYVPWDAGLRVTGGAGAGTREFGSAGLRQAGSGWEDENYSGAAGKFDLTARVSLGKITIRRY